MGGEDPGPNRTQVIKPDSTTTEARTDYAYCSDRLQANCTEETRGFFGGENKGAAAACWRQNLPTVCPPSLSGGPSQGSPR
jgi:hypothetical protein